MENQMRCDWCEEGICTYWGEVEDQYEKEQDGTPVAYCDGTEDEMKECGVNYERI